MYLYVPDSSRKPGYIVLSTGVTSSDSSKSSSPNNRDRDWRRSSNHSATRRLRSRFLSEDSPGITVSSRGESRFGGVESRFRSRFLGERDKFPSSCPALTDGPRLHQSVSQHQGKRSAENPSSVGHELGNHRPVHERTTSTHRLIPIQSTLHWHIRGVGGASGVPSS